METILLYPRRYLSLWIHLLLFLSSLIFLGGAWYLVYTSNHFARNEWWTLIFPLFFIFWGLCVIKECVMAFICRNFRCELSDVVKNAHKFMATVKIYSTIKTDWITSNISIYYTAPECATQKMKDCTITKNDSTNSYRLEILIPDYWNNAKIFLRIPLLPKLNLFPCMFLLHKVTPTYKHEMIVPSARKILVHHTCHPPVWLQLVIAISLFASGLSIYTVFKYTMLKALPAHFSFLWGLPLILVICGIMIIAKVIIIKNLSRYLKCELSAVSNSESGKIMAHIKLYSENAGNLQSFRVSLALLATRPTINGDSTYQKMSKIKNATLVQMGDANSYKIEAPVPSNCSHGSLFVRVSFLPVTSFFSCLFLIHKW